jgi:hypothetical protein
MCYACIYVYVDMHIFIHEITISDINKYVTDVLKISMTRLWYYLYVYVRIYVLCMYICVCRHVYMYICIYETILSDIKYSSDDLKISMTRLWYIFVCVCTYMCYVYIHIYVCTWILRMSRMIC